MRIRQIILDASRNSMGSEMSVVENRLQLNHIENWLYLVLFPEVRPAFETGNVILVDLPLIFEISAVKWIDETRGNSSVVENRLQLNHIENWLYLVLFPEVRPAFETGNVILVDLPLIFEISAVKWIDETRGNSV